MPNATVENLNLRFEEPVIVELEATPWARSPGGEVERRLLERAYAESGHATSVVRYGPGTSFPKHRHGGGEEYLVLEGVFSDEHGDYPAGAYVRNPIGSVHAPFSRDGCTIFVKLCQMRSEHRRVVIARDALQWRGLGGAMAVAPLHVDDRERVDRVKVSEDARLAISNAELLVLEGTVQVAGRSLSPLSWLRIPNGQLVELELTAGTSLWRKRGHLPAKT